MLHRRSTAHKERGRGGRAALLVLVALSAGACSPSGVSGQAPPSGQRPPAREVVEAPTLPPGVRGVLANAEAELVEECMEQRGFRFFHDPVDPDEPAPSERALEAELHLDDVERARREGFGLPGPSVPTRAERAEAAYLASLSPARRKEWDRALGDLGPGAERITVTVPGAGTMEMPAEGCFAEARAELYGDYPRWFRADTFVNTRYLAVREAVRKAPRFARATQEWSACMRGRGYAYADPEQARAEAAAPARGRAGGRAGGEGRGHRTAVDSAECDLAVGRSRTHRALWEEQTRRWAAAHRDEVAAYRELNAAALVRVGADGSGR
ncbi:hypothetical protein GQS52_26395 [Streptomyces sp. SCUT-3]|uniref:hypothetical protein n=1 Tax=Streptomyces sp. SCUT-3 TaxID=2684469 RepID=UPI0015FD974C|nr:hypothetical protein [Streptomyces sp. SCUT-3]QMV24707.1 hypothetical protein GQS52_26395 [Streptomyces sp. SCUT-3]